MRKGKTRSLFIVKYAELVYVFLVGISAILSIVNLSPKRVDAETRKESREGRRFFSYITVTVEIRSTGFSAVMALYCKKNGKSSFLPQIGLMDRPIGNNKKMRKSLKGVLRYIYTRYTI